MKELKMILLGLSLVGLSYAALPDKKIYDSLKVAADVKNKKLAIKEVGALNCFKETKNKASAYQCSLSIVRDFEAEDSMHRKIYDSLDVSEKTEYTGSTDSIRKTKSAGNLLCVKELVNTTDAEALHSCHLL